MSLLKGQRYHATISLGMFERFAGNEKIQVRLEEAGFERLVVTGSGGYRDAFGTWAREDAHDVELPSQVLLVTLVDFE